MSRAATIVAQFVGDISDAEAKYNSLVQAASKGIPVNFTGGGGGTGGGTSTLGGATVSSSASFPTGAASPNFSFIGSQIAQQISAALAPALQQMTASIPTSSPNWANYFGGIQNQLQAMTPTSSPNWGALMQQSMTNAMYPTGASSPNWSYLLGNRGGPPRTPGTGGMRGLFAGGMVLHSALGVADAARENNIDSALVGRNDFAGQYEASMAYRKRLTGSIPFIGGVYDLIEDPSGNEEAGGRLALQGAKDTDAATAGMRSAFMARGRMAGEYSALSAPAGYLRNKAEIENRFGPLSSMGQKDLRDREVAPLSKQHEGNRQEIQQRFGEQISGVYGAAGAGPGVGANMAGQADALQRQMDDALRAEDAAYSALVAQVDQRYANIDKLRDSARKAADASNERQRTADVGSLRRQAGGGYTGTRGALVDRQMHESDLADPGDSEMKRLLDDAHAAELGRFDLVSGNRFRVTTAANMMRARGDTFGASMMAAGGAAFNEYANADATQRFQALGSGLSGMYAQFMEGGGNMALAASHAATGTAANAQQLGRNPFGAQLTQLEGARQAALFPVRNSPFAGVLRGAVNGFFDSQAEVLQMRRSDALDSADLRLGGQRDQIQSLLRHDPVGAMVAGQVTTGLEDAIQFRNAGMASEQRQSLQNSISQLQLTKQNFLESFHATSVGQNFDTSSPRGTAKMEQVFEDIQAGIDKLTTALKDASAAK